jgi:hypothetical protein
MSEDQGRKDTEQMGREIEWLIKTLFVGRFISRENNQISDFEWESLVSDQDLGKQFVMVTRVLEDGGISFSYGTIDNDEAHDIEESVRALHTKKQFILRNSKVFKVDELEPL